MKIKFPRITGIIRPVHIRTLTVYKSLLLTRKIFFSQITIIYILGKPDDDTNHQNCTKEAVRNLVQQQ